MIESPSQVRRMPVWLSVGLIALTLAGGSYAVYWFLQSSTDAQDIVLDRDPNDSVTEGGINHDTWRVKAGGFGLTITGRKNRLSRRSSENLKGSASNKLMLFRWPGGSPTTGRFARRSS